MAKQRVKTDETFRKNTRLYGYVLVVATVSVVSCVAAIITQFTHCLPLHHNWQILPDPGSRSLSFCSRIPIVLIVYRGVLGWHRN